MDTLVIESKTKSNARLLTTLARKLGDRVVGDNRKPASTLTHHASESALAKDWLTKEEDLAWKDL